MDEQAKTIITLFLLLLVLAGVAVAKVTGIFDKEDLVMEGTEYVEYSSEELMAIAEKASEEEKLKEQQALQEAANNGDVGALINGSLDSSEFQNALSGLESLVEVFSGVAMIIGLISAIVGILTPIINYKLFIKLGLPSDLVMWLIVGPVVGAVLGFLNIIIITLIWALIQFIMSIRLFLAYIRKLAVNPIIPLAMVIGFAVSWIPVSIIGVVGVLTAVISGIILGIDTTNVTGKMFGKSVAFRIGMFFLSPIFNGKLAFDSNEVVVMSALEARESQATGIKSKVRSMSKPMSEYDEEEDFLIFEEIDGEKVSEKTEDIDEFDELEEMTKIEEDKEKVNELPVFSRTSKKEKTVEKIEEVEEIDELEEMTKIEEDKTEEDVNDLPVFSRISKSTDNKKTNKE